MGEFVLIFVLQNPCYLWLFTVFVYIGEVLKICGFFKNLNHLWKRGIHFPFLFKVFKVFFPGLVYFHKKLPTNVSSFGLKYSGWCFPIRTLDIILHRTIVKQSVNPAVVGVINAKTLILWYSCYYSQSTLFISKNF